MECSSLKSTVFNESSLSSANLRWSNLDGSMFQKTDLRNADLCNANLENTKFIDCNLEGAVFNLHTRLPFCFDTAKQKGMILKRRIQKANQICIKDRLFVI